MTGQERRIARLPDELKPEAVAARLGQPDYVERATAARHALWRLRKEEEREEEEFRRGWARSQGRPVLYGR